MKTHSQSKTKLYSIWKDMRKRCLNPKSSRYEYYGAKGVAISKEWDMFIVFQMWSMSNGYKDGLSIDRINSDGNYEPSNCRCTTLLIQKQNRGTFKNNTSGYSGVNWNKKRKKWQVRIQIDNKRIPLGFFNTAKEGAIARDEYITRHKLEHTLNFKKEDLCISE